ncbi:S-adenosyl-L-methionine-dependent methyltransferase [Polychytrium aggregatum]|uniref:S-adenosyl-L-methionine-dependent methyltransferase n=1 Tax=Polychytrium aggregatum TaxID=110093 RepID=UPI0022FE0FBC|nr:S-adenosyl-L-methionine-dependent methyltransferase [Polychytrium aggregatum]KAI9204313.1 S-adenosyl-L-methionine-dependent methyltransferase [Polychytrium aggregatum]
MATPTPETIATRNQELLQCWDNFANDFRHYEKIMQQSWRPLLSHMDLGSARSILEVGCGRGECAKAILGMAPSGCSVVTSDFSSEMIKAATAALEAHDALPNPGREGQLRIEQMSALDLHSVPTASIDRYIANMLLHLVPDLDGMLRETRRVLDAKTGIAGFTIWGDRAQSLVFSLRPGREDSPNFDAGRDLDALARRIHAAGFSKVRMWRQPCIFELWDPERVVEFWMHSEGKTIQDTEWLQEARKRTTRAICDEGKPIGLEAVIILAMP